MLTAKEIAQKIEEIKAICRDDIPLFSDSRPEAKVKRKRACEKDFELFCRTYLPNYFTSPSADFHAEFDEQLEKRNKDLVGLVAPREHAKTVRWHIGYVLHQIVFRQRRFIMLVSETEDLAIYMVLNVRTLLEHNRRIIADFGSLANLGSWANNEFVTKNGVKVLARGYNQPVRGLIYGPHRPDLIMVDDISGRKSARNELLEKEKMEWVIGELHGCLGPAGTLFWTGNRIRKSSAIAQAEREISKNNLDFYFKRYQAIAPDGILLWPQRYDHAYFEKVKRKVGTRMFQSEYQQMDVSGGKWYKTEMFRQFSELEASNQWQFMHQRIIYIDPAYGSKKRSARSRGSDYKVAVVMGKNAGGYYLFDAIVSQQTLDQFGKALCQLYLKWQPPIVWYEGNFQQADVIGDYLDSAATREGIILPRKPYFNFSAKDDRIQKGSVLAENGNYYFNADNDKAWQVIDNLCDYPDVDYDDPADAFATGQEILERGSATVRAKCYRS